MHDEKLTRLNGSRVSDSVHGGFVEPAQLRLSGRQLASACPFGDFIVVGDNDDVVVTKGCRHTMRESPCKRGAG